MRSFIFPLVFFLHAPEVEAATPVRETSEAMLAAISFCMSATTQDNIAVPSGFSFYHDAPVNAASIFAERGMLTTASAPPLVRRFAATSMSGRFGHANYLNARSREGSVWIVFGGQVRGACDIMATGVEDPEQLSTELAMQLGASSKWQPNLVRPATKVAPLSTANYTQYGPLPGQPARGWRLKVQALRSDLAKPDGVQMEVSVLAGDLKGTSATSEARR